MQTYAQSKHLALLLFPAMWLAACSQGAGGSPQFLGNSALNPSNGKISQTSSANNFEAAPAVQKLIYHVGPVDLIAGQTIETMLEKPAKLNFQVAEALWMTGFEPKIIDADGKPLSGELLHKAILFNKHESNPACPSSNSGNPFAVATSTLTRLEIPEGLGYPLVPEDPLEAKVVFHNPTKQDYMGVYFSFEIWAIPMDKAKGFRDVKAVLLDADPSCEYKPIAIEPGAFVEKSQTYTIPSGQGGNLMVANGLLSNYGVSVSLTHQEKGNASLIPFWRAEAVFDETHRVINLTSNPFIDTEGKKINQGDKLTLGVAFDNFSNEWRNEATGSAMVYISPVSAE
ncbi:MAG: hypothetical protein Q7T03_08700 [Deltaproteobacteria bacterium]|nr:hypothetical protein [Deltaproteobacteria bacterium]